LNFSNNPSKKDSININKNLDKSIEMNRVDINNSNDVKRILNDKKVYSLWKRFKGIESESSDENIHHKKSSRKTNNIN